MTGTPIMPVFCALPTMRCTKPRTAVATALWWPDETTDIRMGSCKCHRWPPVIVRCKRGRGMLRPDTGNASNVVPGGRNYRGQADGETGACAGRAVGRDAAAVARHGNLHKGQAQSRPGGVVRTVFVHAYKGRECGLQTSIVHAVALVLDAGDPVIAVALH